MRSIESGMIFKFKLPFEMGIAYAKLVDYGEIRSYDHITIFVYDYFEDKKDISVDFFKDVPWFMNPLPIAIPPNLKGKGAWKSLGILHESRDNQIPIYKEPVNEGFAYDTIEKYREVEWRALIKLKDYVGPLQFDKVRHLEELFLRSTTTIENRIVMNILRYRGDDVEDFFNKHSRKKSWLTDYKTMRYIPLYKLIPQAIRGNPLIRGFVPDEYLDWKWEI